MQVLHVDFVVLRTDRDVSFFASRLVTTLPPPLLLSVEFDPPLPLDRTQALKATGYMTATKV